MIFLFKTSVTFRLWPPDPGTVFLLAGLAMEQSPAAPVHIPSSLEAFFHLARVLTGIFISRDSWVGVTPAFILLRATILVELLRWGLAAFAAA